jgi:hypothetical protein
MLSRLPGKRLCALVDGPRCLLRARLDAGADGLGVARYRAGSRFERIDAQIGRFEAESAKALHALLEPGERLLGTPPRGLACHRHDGADAGAEDCGLACVRKDRLSVELGVSTGRFTDVCADLERRALCRRRGRATNDWRNRGGDELGGVTGELSDRSSALADCRDAGADRLCNLAGGRCARELAKDGGCEYANLTERVSGRVARRCLAIGLGERRLCERDIGETECGSRRSTRCGRADGGEHAFAVFLLEFVFFRFFRREVAPALRLELRCARRWAAVLLALWRDERDRFVAHFAVNPAAAACSFAVSPPSKTLGFTPRRRSAPL